MSYIAPHIINNGRFAATAILLIMCGVNPVT